MVRHGTRQKVLQKEANRWPPIGVCTPSGHQDLRKLPAVSNLQISEWVDELLYCRSYSPLLTFLKTLKPAFFASEIETFLGELKVDQILRTGFLHAGQFVSGLAESGRCSVNFPPHTGQPPSQTSYSYNGITENPKLETRNSKRIRDYFLSVSAFINGVNKSTGTGKNVVVLCSLEISRIVCRKRNCNAIGSLLIIAAACTIFSAA